MIAVLAVLLFALHVASRVLPDKSGSEPLSFPVIQRKTTKHLGKRDNTVSLTNVSTLTYLIQLQIGTPPQPVEVVLDTGSFELWVDPTCSTASTADQKAECALAGTYNPELSTTYIDKNLSSKITYGKGGVDIKYASDKILLPGTNSQPLQNVIFGLGQSSNDLAWGISGIGHGKGFNTHYNNIIDELYLQGITQSKVFSVSLGSQYDNRAGTVVFGGVDTRKYSGRLHKFVNLPPQLEGNKWGPWRYYIQVDSIGLTKPGEIPYKYDGSSMVALLDTGSTWTYLPQGLVDELAKDTNASLWQDGSYQVPCEMKNDAGWVDFEFGNLTIHVPYSEFITEFEGEYCALGVLPRDGTPILGDSFLRSSYVIFDQTNQDLYLARSAHCGTNKEILSPEPGAASRFIGECSPADGYPTPVPTGLVVAPIALVMWIIGLIFQQVRQEEAPG
ncbi:aspartic peptidase domain-containing protein [Podospora fimiseda]|uniref:Aspartic peptidase domain-containing protein n=1 Tax=Podospora fimiseda TaxID=252190 RepID=A0AAN7BK40_9PEZI|nr:aspartic peptidase domain-containing protein [Podospora fimiseda]